MPNTDPQLRACADWNGDRYGIEGIGRQLLLVDVVMSLVGTLWVSVSGQSMVEWEAQIAERAAIARLADDLENFEDGAL